MRSAHIMENMLLSEEAFLELIPRSGPLLASRLRMQAGELDYSIESLIRLHEIVAAGTSQEERKLPELFLPLTAYVGETIRLRARGRWTFARVAANVIEPSVITFHGNVVLPFMIVYEELCYCLQGSLYGSSLVQL